MSTNIIVYGTLKSGYHNNYILTRGKAVLVNPDVVVPGLELRDSGFPVAFWNKAASMKGELWTLPSDDRKLHDYTIQALDFLENEGLIYERVFLKDTFNSWIYTGNKHYWDRFELELCPQDEHNNYYWERKVV